MNRLRRPEYGFLVGLVALVATYTILYKLGMTHLDGRPRGFAHSFEIVIESMTSTGYGSDAPWNHWVMTVYVAVMQLTGVVAIFAAVPLFVVPVFESALSDRAPRSIPDIEDHVVLCEYTSHGAKLVDELEARDVPYVIVESDGEAADRLYSDGRSVVHGDPEEIVTLRNVNLEDARALLADASDEQNASIVLSAREVEPDLQVVSLVEDPDNATYHEYAGADRVISPEHILGQSLAEKISTRVTSQYEDLGQDDDSFDGTPEGATPAPESFEIAELSIQRGSTLCYETLESSGIREATGANVIGLWDGGEFTSPPRLDAELTESTILLAVGQPEQLRELSSLALAPKRRHASGDVVVLGYGEVGATVVDELARYNVNATVVDLVEASRVDVVGDATEEATLRSAGVPDAETVVFSLEDDTTSIFALLVVSELNPEAEFVVRANDVDSVQKMYQAGADYVLALTTVSGRMLASILLDEDVLSLDTQIALVRTPVPKLVGRTLAQANVRAKTGVTIVAVERDGTVLSSLGPGFEFASGDVVVAAGTDDDINELQAWANPDG